MRRATLILGLPLSAAALVALFYSAVSHQSPKTVEASQAQKASSVDTELEESAVVVARRSEGDFQIPIDTEAPRKSSLVDEATDREMVREEATRDIRDVYPLLTRNLDLTPSEKEALFSFLIEDLIARTKTRFASGIGMNEHERSSSIAAIIGESRLQQFLALERYRREYAEVQRMRSMLEQKDVPLTDRQRDGLLRILVDVREQFETKLTAGAKFDSLESLEDQLTQINDYERHVIELAPSVLSLKQVQYLFERYQAASYKRAYALEWQKQQRADDPSYDLPLFYPSRD